MYNPGQSGLVWTTDGDLLKNSDRNLTTVTGFDNFVRRLLFLLRTNPGEYKYSPTLGIGIQRYAGRVNTPELRATLKTEITRQLINQDIVYPYTPEVIVKKVNSQAISISISISDESFTYQTAISFDLKDGKVVSSDTDQILTPHDDVPEITPGSKAERLTNKYLSRR